MRNSTAIVTLAIGERYFKTWKKFCEPNWQRYAEKHHYDIICIDHVLDASERAQNRSPSWQKCLVLSQDFSNTYERIVWVDSDILINADVAPSIVEDIPLEKVGAVEEFTYSHEAGTVPRQVLDRAYSYWSNAIINYSARDYYTNWGLPTGFDWVVQCGVLVLSPARHRKLLERVYYDYEEKGGGEWNYEMRPLSYELMQAQAIQWIDPRFNLLWPYWQFMYYPFLLKSETSVAFLRRLKRRLATLVGLPCAADLRRVCLQTAFCGAYFLHLGGALCEEAALVDTRASHGVFSCKN